jgi:hypothetical protein
LNTLNAELNPICHLLTLLGGATIVVVSRLRVKCDFFLFHGLFLSFLLSLLSDRSCVYGDAADEVDGDNSNDIY